MDEIIIRSGDEDALENGYTEEIFTSIHKYQQYFILPAHKDITVNFTVYNYSEDEIPSYENIFIYTEFTILTITNKIYRQYLKIFLKQIKDNKYEVTKNTIQI